MSQRLNEMTWIWSLLVVYCGQIWNPVTCGTIPSRATQSATGVIESQAKFFQDFFSVQLSPYKIEFGHVCEDPNTWEQRYEKKDYKNHRDMGKVRWGDKNGGYGEHYWDLNHAGHNNDHDDGEYHSGGYHDDDSYDESSEQASKYEDVKKGANDMEDSERKKRAHIPKTSDIENEREISDENVDLAEGRALKTQKKRPEQPTKQREKNDIVLIVNERVREENKMPRQSIRNPYDSGLQSRHNIETPSASRLYFEPSTGRVIDTRTGQAFILQPVLNYNN